MKTSEIKTALGLGSDWKRVSKIKLGDISIRVFNSEEEDDTKIVVEDSSGVRELTYDDADGFQDRLQTYILENEDKGPTELVKEFLLSNSQDFILASLSQLRHLEYPGNLKDAVSDLTRISKFEDVVVEEGFSDGSFYIELEDSGDSVGDCCFRLEYGKDNVEIVTD